MMKHAINQLIQDGKNRGWMFIRGRDPVGKYCGFYHGDPAAEVVYYSKLTEDIMLRAFALAEREVHK